MELSIFLARLLAIVFLIMGVGTLINQDKYRQIFDEIKKSQSFIFLAGVLGIVGGFSIVSAHNTWVDDWTTIITVLGWIMFVKGTLLLLVPEFGLGIAERALKMKSLVKVVGVFCVLIGLVMGYFAFLI